MSDYVINVENLCRDYVIEKGFIKRKKSVVHAVKNISFKVEEGEIYGLLGSNGAGKTTTIKMLTTLLLPTAGVCKVLGYDAYVQEKYIRPKINFIFGGEQGVYRRLSGLDNLRYFSNLYKISEHEQKTRIPYLLQLVGLEDASEYRVETYSKGMIQRLQIAKGLINDPKIVFMDEPTIGLDPIGALKLRKIIKSLSDQKKTILLTTHYMHEAEELCKHVAIINHGKMIANDTIDNLKKQIDNISTLTVELKQMISLEQLSLVNGIQKIGWLDKENKILVLKILDNGKSCISDVINLFGSQNVKSIEVKTPSLEDVYINLMGEDYV